MTLIERVKNICLTPKTEWPVIESEPASTAGLVTGYIAPLAALGAIAGFIGGSLIGRSAFFLGTYRVPIVAGIVGAVVAFVLAIAGVFVVAFVINALAPNFGAEKNSARAFKVAAYSYTPALVAGVLQIAPGLGIIAGLIGLYGLYLLYLGLQSLMKSPQDKAVGYTAVVVVCAIVSFFVLASVGAAVVGVGALGTSAGTGLFSRVTGSGGSSSSSSDEVKFDANSPLGKLQELGKKMEESNKKMEAAQKSGDGNAQAAAALEGLGTLLGGGKHVDPIGIEMLKPFVPDSFAGLAKKSSNAEKNGFAGLAVSKAEATYGDGQKRATLEISDTGGISGIVGLASWVGVQGEKDDDNETERTQKVNGRLIHEKQSKHGGSNEFGVVLGERFIVSATGNGVDLNDLKAAVQTLDLARLESMKDVGAQK